LYGIHFSWALSVGGIFSWALGGSRGVRCAITSAIHLQPSLAAQHHSNPISSRAQGAGRTVQRAGRDAKSLIVMLQVISCFAFSLVLLLSITRTYLSRAPDCHVWS